MTKFKKGDLARICKDIPETERYHIGGPNLIPEMYEYLGKVYTIKEFRRYGRVIFLEIPYVWHEDWLEKPCRLSRRKKYE